MGIREQTVSSIKWVAIFQVLKQVVQFGVSITLARLLIPSDYGLVTMSAVIIGFVEAGGNLGISQSIIQKTKFDNDHLNSAFWGTFIFGIFIYIVMVCIAPLIASYYEKKILFEIVIISSLKFGIKPLVITHISLLQKDMRFKELQIITFISFISSAAFAITLALMGKGVWSLVLGSLFAFPVEMFLVWRTVKWRPKYRFIWSKFKELLNFGIYLSLQGLLNYSAQNYDYFVIGKIAGAKTLGVYSIAYDFASKPHTQISPMLTQVLFPAFSRIQNDNERIRRAYIKATAILSSITFPIMGGIFCIADEFILVAYGPKWIEVAPILKILCLMGALKSIGTMVGSIQNAKGRPDIGLWLNLLIISVYIPALIIAAKHSGAIGVAWSLIILGIPLSLLSQKFTVKLIKLKLRTYLAALLRPSILTLIMIGVVLLLKQLLYILSANNVFVLLVSICSGVFVYTALLFLFNKTIFYELLAVVRLK